MSDRQVRELERRWRETRDPEDRRAWLRARGRSGGLPPSRLALEAFLGDLAARALLGWGRDVDVGDAAALLAPDLPWCAWLGARAVEAVLERCPLLQGAQGDEARAILRLAREAAERPSPRRAAEVQNRLGCLWASQEHQADCPVHRALAQVGLATPASPPGEQGGWQARASAAAAAVALSLAARAAGPDRAQLLALLRAWAG